MKKTFAIFLIIILLLFFSKGVYASISVNPPELLISMTDEFIHGNTSKRIDVSNNFDYNFNITWYKEHPNPIDWMRPNRSFIPDLSWIYMEPQWFEIPSNSTGSFYIYLDIPKEDENYEQHWETWVTFKKGIQEQGGGFFNQEYAIRIYVDTPEKTTDTDENGIPLIIVEDQENIHWIGFLIIPIIILILIVILVIKRKKTNF
jgi:hypothetical protein